MDGKFKKIFYLYASTQFISTIISSLGGFLVARLMKPEVMGEFNGIGIFLGYLALLPFGILNGLGRELPYEIGRGNIDLVHNYVKVSWVVSLILSFLVFGGVSFFLIKSIIAHDIFSIWAYSCYCIVGFFQIINKLYFSSIYRTSSDFKRLSWIGLVLAISNLLLVYFVYVFDYRGMAIRMAALYVMEFLLLLRYNPQPFIGKFHWKEFKSLFKTGFPIFLVGNLMPIWVTAQNTLIFTWGGAKAFGLFSVVTMVTAFLGLIPQSLGHMVYPQMSMAYGEGKSKKYIINIAVKSAKDVFIISLIFGVIAWFAMPYVIRFLLPKYQSAIFTAQLAIIAPLLMNVGLINNYFNVIKKQMPYFVSIVIGVVANVSFLLIAYRFAGFRLEIFPIGAAIGLCFQYAYNAVYIYKDVTRNEYIKET